MTSSVVVVFQWYGRLPGGSIVSGSLRGPNESDHRDRLSFRLSLLDLIGHVADD